MKIFVKLEKEIETGQMKMNGISLISDLRILSENFLVFKSFGSDRDPSLGVKLLISIHSCRAASHTMSYRSLKMFACGQDGIYACENNHRVVISVTC